MTRRMLINAQHKEECRVAVAEDDQLLELEVEKAGQVQLKGNIYKAPTTRIEPSLQAAFLDIGANRNGFLQINDINPTYFSNWPPDKVDGKIPRPAIQDVLSSSQDLVVQVVKDERAAKGATLTTNLSIPGRYLVLMVGNQRGGVSRKIVDEGQRSRLRGAVRDLKIPPGMGVIVRTAGINKSSTQLQGDLDALLETWYYVVKKSLQPGGPILLYKESDLAIRTIRDYLTGDIDEILIDDQETYDDAMQFVDRVIPTFRSKIKFYDQPQPLFSAYHLDTQVEETDYSEVTLPSGGSIVINVTEAVVAIDVNSGRATSQSDVEETAFETNKEAAVAIAKQLRLRDLGGLIVLDFIDMSDRWHKQAVEKALRDAVCTDKAKVEIGRISRFGLLEMSRQRLKSSLVSQSHGVCPHCAGRGRVKTYESAALDGLRKIQSAAFAGGVEQIKIHMAPAAALLLLNEKRHMLTDFETRSKTKIVVFADGRMKPEEYKLELVTEKHGSQVEQRLTTSKSRSTEEGSQSDTPRGKGQQSSSDRRRSGGRTRQNSRSAGGRNNNQRNRGGRKRGPRRDNSKRYGSRRPKTDSNETSSTEKSSTGKAAEPNNAKAPTKQPGAKKPEAKKSESRNSGSDKVALDAKPTSPKKDSESKSFVQDPPKTVA